MSLSIAHIVELKELRRLVDQLAARVSALEQAPPQKQPLTLKQLRASERAADGSQ